MPVVFQKIIKREDLRRNPQVTYVFGDNVARVGMGGQAAEMRHEPNAIGVATKMRPNAYFGEEAIEIMAQKKIIDEDMKPLFKDLLEGRIVVWPSDGIGTGLAELPSRAPTTHEYIEAKLLALVRVGKLHDKGRDRQAEEEAEAHL